jgi:predicted RNase H-like HicB family nuclease
LELLQIQSLAVARPEFYLVTIPMTYAILVEKAPSGELPAGFYYAHVPALGLTTHGRGIEGARAAAEDLIKLWLAEKKAAGEAIDVPSEFFFSTVDISESALQSA